jgi:hypothetical protein
MLRHYPSEYDMKQVSQTSSDIFQEQMEPLYRMVKAYSIDKENEAKD